MSPKQNCYQNWKVTKHIKVLKNKIEIQEIGTDHLGLVTIFCLVHLISGCVIPPPPWSCDLRTNEREHQQTTHGGTWRLYDQLGPEGQVGENHNQHIFTRNKKHIGVSSSVFSCFERRWKSVLYREALTVKLKIWEHFKILKEGHQQWVKEIFSSQLRLPLFFK